ncbi:MAG: hypothetical protein KHY12_07925 [Firmicutes bacterium]|nr:hypothetical protein [Oscillospiraceae bacterium]MBS5433670.1 hypothetical protein [Bacillota bacterium]
MKEIFSKINVKRVLSYALYMFLALVAQNMLFTQFRLFGTCPMVLPAVAVAVGMFQGATWGSIFALVMGIFADMAYVENTVTFTLIFPALAFAAGFISQFFINRRFFAFMGAALAGLFVTALVQMLKTLAADGFSMAMVGTVLLQTLWSLPPAALAYFPPAKWIE